MKERWKKLKESPECRISNLGRIYRKETIRVFKRKNGHFMQRVPGKFVIGPRLSSKGYPRVSLRGTVYFVHSLVAKYFIPNHMKKPQINHIDGNKLNNRVDNLEWVTNQENRDHAVRNGLIARGEKLSSLTEKQVLKIRHLYGCGARICQIARLFKEDRRNISKIVHRKSWRHI